MNPTSTHIVDGLRTLDGQMAASGYGADHPWRAALAELADRATDSPAQGSGTVDDPAEIWETALAHVSLYVEDHCVDGETHANVIMTMKRPPFAVPAQVEQKPVAGLAQAIRELRCVNPYPEDSAGLYVEGYAAARREAADLAVTSVPSDSTTGAGDHTSGASAQNTGAAPVVTPDQAAAMRNVVLEEAAELFDAPVAAELLNHDIAAIIRRIKRQPAAPCRGCADKQLTIDRLMREYCYGPVAAGQVAEWAKRQERNEGMEKQDD